MNLFLELINFFSAALQCVPFMILAVLAYLGVRNPSLKWLAVGWLAMLVIGFALMALAFGTMAGLDLAKLMANPGSPPILKVNGFWMFGVLGAGILLSMVMAGVFYLPAVRRWLARVLPMDANSFVHATALAAVLPLTLLCLLPLLAAGQPPLLALLKGMPAEATGGGMMDAGTSARAMLYTLMWMVPCTIFAVGAGISRSPKQALERLGMVRPTLRQVLLGFAMAIAMVVVVSVLGRGLDAFWNAMGWPKTDSETFAKLIAFALNPLGALLVGIVAGVGEELAVRGVLQPRLGLFISNAFFAALHALQYSWDALLVVFLIGMALGVLRKRTNTSTSAIAHGAYDFILLMLAWAQVPGFDK